MKRNELDRALTARIEASGKCQIIKSASHLEEIWRTGSLQRKPILKMADDTTYQSRIIVGSEIGNLRKEYGIKSVDSAHNKNMIVCNVRMAQPLRAAY